MRIPARTVDVRLPTTIISMIKWIRTSRLSIKISLSGSLRRVVCTRSATVSTGVYDSTFSQQCRMRHTLLPAMSLRAVSNDASGRARHTVPSAKSCTTHSVVSRDSPGVHPNPCFVPCATHTDVSSVTPLQLRSAILWEGYRESRSCSRDTFPEAYIT